MTNTQESQPTQVRWPDPLTNSESHIAIKNADDGDEDEPVAGAPDGYHLSRAGSWDPYQADPVEIDDH